ncbi:palindromic element RPE1 domain-containing protein [Candidatus Tisiphia endosymbiont of Hybos culiciformis]|uniref:palindromic element RPE1 domain-containing protein n=1 Tax=Candidatus Tisiphia endosymbiont of Hybos culiciformis TaxID=3139331 RepID=UPI003CCB2433
MPIIIENDNRPFAKLAYAEEFEGDAERRTAAYSNVREDSSTASTYKLPAEVELGKRSNKAKPFVKWVGGKRSLIKELSTRTPQTYKSYYEPFIGGGALLFALAPSSATISDINRDLVITYAVIKHKPQELIKLLAKHKVNHGEEYYYKIRKHFING